MKTCTGVEKSSELRDNQSEAEITQGPLFQSPFFPYGTSLFLRQASRPNCPFHFGNF